MEKIKKNLLRYIENGDELFKQQKWKESIEEYSKALSIDENLMIIQKELKFKRCKTSAHDHQINYEQKLNFSHI